MADFYLPKLRGANLQLLTNHDHEVILCGGADCVAGHTIIDGNRIDWLCENGVAPMVDTLYGKVKAGVPFCKGEDDLYEVSTDCGTFTATARHLVLTNEGFCFVSDLNGKLLLGCAASRLRSNSDIGQSVPLSDARHLSKIIRDSRCDCQPSLRLGDESSYMVYQKRAQVKWVGRGKFYDLTVPDIHHYIAEGHIHHNTGKTWSCCVKSFLLCTDPNLPNVHGAVCRKVHATMEHSVLRTFRTIFDGLPIRRVGGQWTDKYIFPNGSQLVVVGLDKPEKLLSSEWDFVQVCQAEELIESDWELVGSRVTGRGAILPFPQIFGDCNPSYRTHWIPTRSKTGTLTLLSSRHQDNPSLYHDDGSPTEDGVKRLALLNKTLTGVRRERLLFSKWATAEGAVFPDFIAAVGGIHVLERDPNEMKAWYIAIDPGFTNPCSQLLIGVDGDGRWHIFAEWYERQKLQSEVIEHAVGWYFDVRSELRSIRSMNPVRVQSVSVDAADPELIAGLNSRGLYALSGKGEIESGNDKLRDRLKAQGDGKARLTMSASCVNTINEFESYCFSPAGKSGGVKEVPIDKDNHCFTGETRVLTKTGLRRIDEIRAGEMVWSPFGWNRVWQSSCTGKRLVKDYGLFRATPDHKILTARGLISIDALRYLDKVFVWQQTKKWSLKEFLSGVTRSQRKEMTGFISEALAVKLRMAARYTYTSSYGKGIMARFRLAWKYITATATLATMRLITCSLSAKENTQRSIVGEEPANTCSAFSLSLPPEQGLSPQHQKATQHLSNEEGGVGKTNGCMSVPVLSAGSDSPHRFLRDAGSVISTAKCEHCEREGIQTCFHTSHTATATLALTFNLNTEYGCFFAEGVLVSNSIAALRYLQDVNAETEPDIQSERVVTPRQAARVVSTRRRGLIL
jgi:phage terminase large subunit